MKAIFCSILSVFGLLSFCVDETKVPSSAFQNPNSEGCPEISQPVCGKIEIQCIKTPCDPVEETFVNECFAEKAKATDLRPGKCEKQLQMTNLLPIGSGFGGQVNDELQIKENSKNKPEIANPHSEIRPIRHSSKNDGENPKSLIACPANYDPVCGTKNSEQKNYSNGCKAEVDGAEVLHKGECTEKSQITNSKSQTNLEAELKSALKQKMKSLSKITDFEVSKITHQTDNHLRGIVKLTDIPGQGPFLAVKENGRWKVVFQGNKPISCKEMLVLDFPTEMITDCVEEVIQ